MSELQAAGETLQALRARGDWRVDPARFHALEALARRIPQQPAPVQRLLQHKLQAALAAYVAQLEQGPASAVAKISVGDAIPSPLAKLNRELRAARPDDTSEQELASVRGFRRTWSRLRTLDQVDHAVARKPANPGPLNSHALVVQSLEWIRSLSPDYLRALVGYVETLQWLEDAGAKAPRQAAGAKKTKAKSASQRGRAKG